MDRQISVPIKKEDAVSLRAGDYVTLTGTIYTARDAAHKRMQETLDAGEALPIEMQGNVIYYMGPSPAREGRPIGSAVCRRRSGRRRAERPHSPKLSESSHRTSVPARQSR